MGETWKLESGAIQKLNWKWRIVTEKAVWLEMKLERQVGAWISKINVLKLIFDDKVCIWTRGNVSVVLFIYKRMQGPMGGVIVTQIVISFFPSSQSSNLRSLIGWPQGKSCIFNWALEKHDEFLHLDFKNLRKKERQNSMSHLCE